MTFFDIGRHCNLLNSENIGSSRAMGRVEVRRKIMVTEISQVQNMCAKLEKAPLVTVKSGMCNHHEEAELDVKHQDDRRVLPKQSS